MDWSFIQKFTPMYVEAAWLTLVIGVLGIVLSIAIGLICAWVKYYKVPVARQIVAVYIELSRNTPLIVQLFFLYFGKRVYFCQAKHAVLSVWLSWAEATWQKAS